MPADYATIQEALDVSGVGDTVLVAAGTYSDYRIYFGNEATVAFVPDGVVLKSEAGPTLTTIDLAPLEPVATSATAFSCLNHTSGLTVIEGFRVVGFPPLSAGLGVGYCAQVEVRNCVFERDAPPDALTYRKGVSSRESALSVGDCSFIRCSGPDGAGISHFGGPLTVESCTFIECKNQGIRAQTGDGPGPHTLEVRDCFFQRVSGTATGGCIQSGMDHGELIEGCVFEEPGLTALGATGAALGLYGEGSKTIANSVFHDMNLTIGIACVDLVSGTANVFGNTFAHCHQPQIPSSAPGSVMYTFFLEGMSFSNNVVAHTSGAKALSFRSGAGPVTLGCNVFWDNEDGIGQPLDPTDRIADPQFCDPDGRDYTLQSTSPCLPPYSLGCDLIGALGQGCGSVSVEPESWAKVKAAYRDPSADGREEEKE